MTMSDSLEELADFDQRNTQSYTPQVNTQNNLAPLVFPDWLDCLAVLNISAILLKYSTALHRSFAWANQLQIYIFCTLQFPLIFTLINIKVINLSILTIKCTFFGQNIYITFVETLVYFSFLFCNETVITRAKDLLLQ